MTALADLVKATNLYIDGCVSDQRKPVSLVLRNAAKFITKIFKILGLIPETSGVDIGIPVGGSGDQGEEKLTPVLDALIDFLSSVRA